MQLRHLLPLCGLGALVACGDDGPTHPVVDPTCGTPLSLRRGEMRTLSGASTLSCVAISPATEATEYLLVVANATATKDDVMSYRVVATSDDRATTTVVPSPLRRSAEVPADSFEQRVRDSEQRLLAGHSLSALSRPLGARHTTATSALAVGDTMRLHVPDASTSDLCANFVDVRAVVKAVSTKAVVALDATAPPGFSDAEFRDIASEFDSLILPTDTQWFGAPTDMNGDGRVTILFTPRINRLTPTGSLGYVGGFFFASDLLPRSNPAQNWRCDSSNEQEVFYLLTPDPTGTVNGNRFSLETSREAARGTIAHELQHMINQGVRQSITKADHLEVAWLNEGLSHLAEELVGRASRGYADGRRLTWNDVLAELDDFDSFFRQNLLRYRAWLERPDQWSPIGGNALTQLAPRGAAWAFVRYAADRYSGTDARGFVRALAAGPQVDVANLEARTRAPFEDVLSGFLIASYAGSVQELDARFSFASWSMRDVMTELSGGVYPLRVVSLPANVATQAPSGSGDFFTLDRPAGAKAATVRIQSTTGEALSYAGARLHVLRVK